MVPSALTSRTCGALIWWLKRGPEFFAGALSVVGTLAMEGSYPLLSL
jgi:hypothetical protein